MDNQHPGASLLDRQPLHFYIAAATVAGFTNGPAIEGKKAYLLALETFMLYAECAEKLELDRE